MAMTFYPTDHPGVPTACVDRYWRCYYNRKWFGALTADQSAAVLVHEMWHPLRFHFFRAMSVGVSPETRLIWNLVTDAEIHEGSGRLIEMLQTLQNVSPVTRESFDPPLKERGTSESWYHELLNRESTQTVDFVDDKGLVTRMKVPQMANGGDPRSTVPGFGHIDGSGSDGLPAEWELPSPVDGGPPGVQPERVIVIQRQVAQAIRSSQQRGDEARSLERWAEDILAHKVDWREQFRTAFQGVMAPVMGFTQSTYRRMSRRESPDPRIIPPGWIGSIPRVAVIVDTSGSMGSDRLSQCRAEVTAAIDTLNRHGKGPGVKVYSCDAAAHEAQNVYNGAEVRLLGGGGTDLTKGFDLVEFDIKSGKHNYDILVVMTDGITPWPEQAFVIPTITMILNEKSSAPPWMSIAPNSVVLVSED